jgi:hypothetical protein
MKFWIFLQKSECACAVSEKPFWRAMIVDQRMRVAVKGQAEDAA